MTRAGLPQYAAAPVPSTGTRLCLCVRHTGWENQDTVPWAQATCALEQLSIADWGVVRRTRGLAMGGAATAGSLPETRSTPGGATPGGRGHWWLWRCLLVDAHSW